MKTRIKEIIQQHNEMYDAFKKLNEKMANGDYLGIGDGYYIKLNVGSTQSSGYNFDPPQTKFEVKTQKFEVGDYLTIIDSNKDKWIGILRGGLHRENDGFPFYAGIDRAGDFRINSSFGFQDGNCMSLSTPEEIALLDSKLAEQGKRFDKEKCEIVEIEKEIKNCEGCAYGINNCCFYHKPGCVRTPEVQPIPKHKEPIIGEIAIFWDDLKNEAVTAINSENEHSYVNDYPYQANDGTVYGHAIPYESIDQYKQFLKS